MLEYSEVTHRFYQPEECVFFRNLIQLSYYVANNATIIDVFTDSQEKLVFVFLREEHNDLIKKWNNRKPREKSESGRVENGG